jgi:hypothetical protein
MSKLKSVALTDREAINTNCTITPSISGAFFPLPL